MGARPSTEPPEIRVVSPEKAIVVVGDNPECREALGSALRATGLPAPETMTVSEAKDGLAQQRPALVILGLSHLDSEGRELLSSLRNLPHLRDTPIVVFLSDASNGAVEQAFALGAADCAAAASFAEWAARVKNQWDRRHRQLERLERLESELATIAHDLNQPLTSVMGYGEVLLRQMGETAPLAHAARMIVSEAERMAQIVRRLARKPSSDKSGVGKPQ
jgi:CheY-like chemotaxis protein